MRHTFLGLGALGVAIAACGGSDTTIPFQDGGGDGADGAPGCVPEICGDGKDNDCDGVAENGCNGIGTFVSIGVGNDTNPGTQASPVKTIAKGIANAKTIGGTQTVFVAQGVYPEKVTLTEGISLEGGYDCAVSPCTWAYDTTKFDSVIQNPDFEGVLAPDGVTRKTHLQGFRVMGMAGLSTTAPGSAAITVKGSPTLRNNRVVGGDVSGAGGSGQTQRSIGIAVLAPTTDPNGALIERNDIKGGSSVGSTHGIFIDVVAPATGKANVEIVKNTITGGTAPGSNGITAWASGTAKVSDNDITMGNQGNLAGQGGSVWGIVVGGNMTIDKNRINVNQTAAGGCSGTTWCGGIASYSSTSTITNNVIFGSPKSQRSTAIYLAEAEKPAGIVILNANYLNGSGMTASNPTSSVGLTLHIGFGTNALLGRTRNNIIVGGNGFNRYGVYEDHVTGKTNKPEVLENNDFWFVPATAGVNVFHHTWDGATGTDVKTVPATNNINVDPMTDPSFHIGATSGCIDKGIATEAPAQDMDGDPRPKGAGIDIGCDEAK